jgi:hypothetical protein
MHTMVGIFLHMNAANQSAIGFFAKFPFFFAIGLANHKKRILQSYPFFNKPDASAIQVLNRIESSFISKFL